jgi:hypothetical protein
MAAADADFRLLDDASGLALPMSPGSKLAQQPFVLDPLGGVLALRRTGSARPRTSGAMRHVVRLVYLAPIHETTVVNTSCRTSTWAFVRVCDMHDLDEWWVVVKDGAGLEVATRGTR